MGSMGMRVGNMEKGNMRTGWGICGRGYGDGVGEMREGVYEGRGRGWGIWRREL
jgi:hypothetical protein